jgi:hypothetical protein
MPMLPCPATLARLAPAAAAAWRLATGGRGWWPRSGRALRRSGPRPAPPCTSLPALPRSLALVATIAPRVPLPSPQGSAAARHCRSRSRLSCHLCMLDFIASCAAVVIKGEGRIGHVFLVAMVGAHRSSRPVPSTPLHSFFPSSFKRVGSTLALQSSYAPRCPRRG